MRSRVKKAESRTGSGGTKKKENIRLRLEMVMRRMKESEWRLTWRQVAHTFGSRRTKDEKKRKGHEG